MINSVFTSFLKTQLETLSETITKETGASYDIVVSQNINFQPANDDKVYANIIYGAEQKIEGSPSSLFLNFNINIFAEKNTNGLYTEKLFKFLFDNFSMKSFKLVVDDTTYYVFTNFGTLMLLDPRFNSGTGYRCHYSLTGQIIYSESAQIGRHTYIAFPTSSSTESNVTWTEIEITNPGEFRENNLSAKSTSDGVAYIKGNPSYSGNFAFILDNSDVALKFIKYIHKAETIDSIWLKYEYQDYTVIEKKLIIHSARLGLDDNTRNTVITIEYVKDDVYGV